MIDLRVVRWVLCGPGGDQIVLNHPSVFLLAMAALSGSSGVLNSLLGAAPLASAAVLSSFRGLATVVSQGWYLLAQILVHSDSLHVKVITIRFFHRRVRAPGAQGRWPSPHPAA